MHLSTLQRSKKEFFNLLLQLSIQCCKVFLVSVTLFTLFGCREELAGAAASTPSVEKTLLNVLKDPSCGCCELWVDHIVENGFLAQISHPADLNSEKLDRGIAPRYQSCHTAVSSDGFVFEGHVPAKLIQRFLAEKPANAIGLAVPGMPLGSPGMELGAQFTPYEVLILNADGSAEVYATISDQADQY